VFLKLRPDLVLVPGDVNSTLAGALAAVKLGIPVCHLESGLRSFDRTMPEEHNRRLTDHVSALLLTHSLEANDNLAREGIGSGVAFVGNTMIDTLRASLGEARQLAAWADYDLRSERYVLVTLHRPGLVDNPVLLARTMESLERVAMEIPVVFPVHPRTRARLRELGFDEGRVLLIEPQPYRRFLSLETCAAAVVTDSGGVQEETTALGVRCFTLRENTERPVTVTHGTNIVLGLDPGRLVEVPARLAERPTRTRPPLWDGRAGVRAAREIERFLGVATGARTRKPPPSRGHHGLAAEAGRGGR
jgi:UDP-N-acetylglucosamine 2-epimerase (non-hydrolysing)